MRIILQWRADRRSIWNGLFGERGWSRRWDDGGRWGRPSHRPSISPKLTSSFQSASTSDFHRPCRRLRIEDASVDQFLQNSADFIRFKRDSHGHGQLQTALLTYRKKFPFSIFQPFLRVDLVSVIHIADKEYFATLQKELEGYDCVLYEFGASRRNLKNSPGPGKKLRSSNLRGYVLQRQMAKFFTLDFQLDCLDYQADNWYHADLDSETFELLQHKKGESIFTSSRDRKLKSTEAMVQPALPREDLGPWRSKLLWAARVVPMPLVGWLIIKGVCADNRNQSEDPEELEALCRLGFGAAMKFILAKGLTYDFAQETADVEDTSMIIGERNRAATEVLRRAIDGGHKKIAIVYGAGHMADLGRRLRKEFDLIPSQVQWITAFSIKNRNLTSSSLPINTCQTLALLILPLLLALDLWVWKLFLGWASNLIHYVINIFM